MNTWSRDSVRTDLTQRSAMALVRDDLKGVRAWIIPRLRARRSKLAAAVVNEKAWRLAIPTAAFDNLLCRPRGGRMCRHMHVQNLPAGVDHEEHV
jgi:hypothetical protein